MKKIYKFTYAIAHFLSLLTGSFLFLICPRLMLGHEKMGAFYALGLCPSGTF